MPRIEITSPTASKVGPYSHAVRSGDLIYLSGQTPIDPATGKLAEGGIQAQTAQCFANLRGVLQAAGLDLEHVIKVNVFLTDMGNFAAMNEVYAQQFQPPYPARTTIGVASLPLNAQIEIEMIARSE